MQLSSSQTKFNTEKTYMLDTQNCDSAKTNTDLAQEVEAYNSIEDLKSVKKQNNKMALQLKVKGNVTRPAD